MHELHEIEWWSDEEIGHQTQVARIQDLSVSAERSVCLSLCVIPAAGRFGGWSGRPPIKCYCEWTLALGCFEP
jgi:hypothetical protein